MPHTVSTAVSYQAPFAGRDCGIVCLKMVLDHYGIAYNNERLYEVLTPRSDGVTARRIVETVRQFGLQATGVRITVPRLLAVAAPAILHWDNRHFVLLEENACPSALRIFDPSIGPRRVPLAEVEARFSGVAILFSKARNR
jgi:ATP-binding cassette, subfamily B, bacterial